MTDGERPYWKLPAGLTRGLWEYVHAEHIADDYDAYFAHNSLFDFDEQVIARWLDPTEKSYQQTAAIVADLGCGTGRALLPLVRRGFRGLAVDLSSRMLGIVRQKAIAENLPIDCLKANLVELDGLADEAVDHAICLFSTLGMIRGSANRRAALAHVSRVLRPGGVFVLHVHNYWYNLYDPGGPWWVVSNWLRAKFVGDIEAGDKFFPYRGLANMYLHVFTRRELTQMLKSVGLRPVEIIALHPQRIRALHAPWFFGRLRANGWIVVSRKR
jgi:ubiquinone/menaquinone biosynthesis C-methylase UbiE